MQKGPIKGVPPRNLDHLGRVSRGTVPNPKDEHLAKSVSRQSVQILRDQPRQEEPPAPLQQNREVEALLSDYALLKKLQDGDRKIFEKFVKESYTELILKTKKGEKEPSLEDKEYNPEELLQTPAGLKMIEKILSSMGVGTKLTKQVSDWIKTAKGIKSLPFIIPDKMVPSKQFDGAVGMIGSILKGLESVGKVSDLIIKRMIVEQVQKHIKEKKDELSPKEKRKLEIWVIKQRKTLAEKGAATTVGMTKLATSISSAILKGLKAFKGKTTTFATKVKPWMQGLSVIGDTLDVVLSSIELHKVRKEVQREERWGKELEQKMTIEPAPEEIVFQRGKGTFYTKYASVLSEIPTDASFEVLKKTFLEKMNLNLDQVNKRLGAKQKNPIRTLDDLIRRKDVKDELLIQFKAPTKAFFDKYASIFSDIPVDANFKTLRDQVQKEMNLNLDQVNERLGAKQKDPIRTLDDLIRRKDVKDELFQLYMEQGQMTALKKEVQMVKPSLEALERNNREEFFKKYASVLNIIKDKASLKKMDAILKKELGLNLKKINEQLENPITNKNDLVRRKEIKDELFNQYVQKRDKDLHDPQAAKAVLLHLKKMEAQTKADEKKQKNIFNGKLMTLNVKLSNHAKINSLKTQLAKATRENNNKKIAKLNKQLSKEMRKVVKKELGLDLKEVNEIRLSHKKSLIESPDDLKSDDVKALLLRMHTTKAKAMSVQMKGALKTAALEKQKIAKRFIKFKKKLSITGLVFAIVALATTVCAIIFLPAAIVSLIGLGFFAAGFLVSGASLIYRLRQRPSVTKAQLPHHAIPKIWNGLKKKIHARRLNKLEKPYLKKSAKYTYLVDKLDQLIKNLQEPGEPGKLVDLTTELKLFGITKGSEHPENVIKKLQALKAGLIQRNDALYQKDEEQLNKLRRRVKNVEDTIESYEKRLSEKKWIDYQNLMRKRMGKKALSSAEIVAHKTALSTYPNAAKELRKARKAFFRVEQAFKLAKKEYVPTATDFVTKEANYEKAKQNLTESKTALERAEEHYKPALLDIQDLLNELPRSLAVLLKEGRADQEMKDFLKDEMQISLAETKTEDDMTAQLSKGLREFFIMTQDQLRDFLKDRSLQRAAERELDNSTS